MKTEEEKENLVKKLISGENLLTVSVCCYPHYQAWVEVDEKRFSVQELLEAVNRILSEKNIKVDFSDVVKFLQKIQENIFCKFVIKYEVKLADLLSIFEKMNQKKAEKEEKKKKKKK